MASKSVSNPIDVLMFYREKISTTSEECLRRVMNKAKRETFNIKGLELSKAQKACLYNLRLQEEEFENFSGDLRVKFSSYISSVENITATYEDIELELLAESALFESFLPAYGYKSQLVTMFERYQVSIIQSHSHYCFQVLLPLVLKKLYPQQFFVSCENYIVAKNYLQSCLNNYVQKVQTKGKSLHDGLLITTENELLNLFSNQKISLNRSMCVIYNLKIDRSVTSDLLLAYIHRMLEDNEYFKLILIIPPFANEEIYLQYFKRNTVSPVLKTPSLSFPVTNVWRTESLTPSVPILEDVIRTVLSIHVLKEAGDVMVCLPSSGDIDYVSRRIKQVCFQSNLSNLKIISLNEFPSHNTKTVNARKVFLAANSVEVLVIETVRFVIDCGVEKRFIYDSTKSCDVPRVTFISKENVKLRESLAGVSSPGVCFHLYSKRNFLEEMHSFALPDIFIVDPVKTLLNLFLHRRNSSNLDLIQPIPKDHYDTTIQDLKKYGAIENNILTSRGENMLSLPFPSKICHLILLGKERDLLYETIVLVAFLKESRQIFQKPRDEKQKQALYAKKLKLVQHESDTLTYIHVYRRYVDENFSASWCEDNYVHHDVLQRIHQAVNDICHVIQRCLGLLVIQEFSSSKMFHMDFVNLLLDGFHHNLCVYTGHRKSGYRVLASSSLAHVNPFCVLSESENLPQFIIYDQLVTSKRNNLINVTAIPHELVLRGLTEGLLDYDYSIIFEKNLVCRSIEHVGDDVMKRLLLGSDGKKVFQIEKQLKQETCSDLIFLEPSLEKGRIDVLAMPEHIDYTYCAIKDILGASLNKVVNEQQVEILELKKGNNRIYVEINCAKGAVATTINVSSQKQNPISLLPSCSLETDMNEQADTFAPFHLFIAWVRRFCSGKGSVNFCSSSNFMPARKMALRYVKLMGSEVFVEVSKKQQNQLLLTDLPAETQVSNLQREIELLLPDLKVTSVDLEYQKPYETSDSEINDIKLKISQRLRELDQLTECDVTILNIESTDINMTAHIKICNSVLLDFISETIISVLTENHKCITEVRYDAIIKCDLKICKALQPRFYSELNSLKEDLKTGANSNQKFKFKISRENDELGTIELSARNSNVLVFLYGAVSSLIDGEIFYLKDLKGFQNLFYHGGHVWLRCLEKAENVLIIEHPHLKLLKLYGSREECDRAKYQIVKFLENAESDVMRKVPLSRGQKNLLLKAVIKEYGVHMERFIESFNLKTAILDIKASELLLRGNRDNVDKAESRIQELANGLDIDIPADDPSQETCPVCFCPAIDLTFRLQHCGHLYCLMCIQALLEKAEFPLRCCSENCLKDITLTDIRKILTDDDKKTTLFEKALKEYLEKNRESISFCPAPDCPMFSFKKDITNDKITCTLCKNEICVKCNVLYHRGFSCDMYQNSKNDPDYSFKVWKKSKECKQCPRCKTAIEKVSGCNRMNCSSCKGTFCWICVTEFPNETQVYNHIDREHRGMLYA